MERISIKSASAREEIAGRRGGKRIESSADASPCPWARTQPTNMRATAEQRGCDHGKSDK